MKRATPLILAILLGALAAGAGIGIFLKLANDDRHRLAAALEDARVTAEQAVKDKQAIANDANQKVEEANAEVAKAQRVVENIKEEQKLMLAAEKLTKPSSYLLRNWSHVVSLSQGIGLSLPPDTGIESDTSAALTAVMSGANAGVTEDRRWLSITPYDANREQEMLASFATSTNISYVVDGVLLTGKTGTMPGGVVTMVLRVRSSGVPTHLLWIKNPGTLGSGDGFKRLLSTLEFDS